MTNKISIYPVLILLSALLFAKVDADKGRTELTEQVTKAEELNKVLRQDIDVVKSVNEELKNEVRRLENSSTELLQQLEIQEEEKRQKEEEIASPFSSIELDLLYRLVECEAGAESEEGKIAVANVVFNRMRSAKFPNTLTEVVYQPHQFQPVTTGFIEVVDVSDETITAVNKAVNGVKTVDDDIVYFWAKWLDKNHEIWDACPISKTIGVHHFASVWN